MRPDCKVSHKQIASTSKARLKTYGCTLQINNSMLFLLCLSPIFSHQMIYFEKTTSLMYDISTNEAPSLIQQLFTKAGNVHAYGTRSATRRNVYVKSSRLEKNSFSRSGTCVWNSLPLKLRHVNKRRFKMELCVSLLNILESENEYIGVSELIPRLAKVKFTV